MRDGGQPRKLASTANLTAGSLDRDGVSRARHAILFWLLLTDGLILGDPQNTGLLRAGARWFGSIGIGIRPGLSTFQN